MPAKPRLTHQPARKESPKKPRPTPPPAPAEPKRRRRPEDLVGAPLARVIEVHTWINEGRRVTSGMLVAEWGVARSTVMRHLACMSERLKMPLAWDAAKNSYIFTRPCPTLPFVVLERRDALVLALAGRVCEVFHGSFFAQRLDAILKKLAPMLGTAVSTSVAALDRVFVPPQPDAFDEFEHFFPLFDAIEQRRAVRLHYTKRESDETEERLVHPLALARRRTDNRWLLVAYDPTRTALRRFLLMRIQEIAAADATFEPPAGIDVRDYLRKSLDHSAEEAAEHDVRVALDARSAFYAREQPWHPSQRLKTLPDGRVELTIRVNDLPGAMNLVLHWGRHVEVLAPAQLRDDVRQELQAAAAQYAASAPRVGPAIAP